MNIGMRTLNNAVFNTVSNLLPMALSFIFWPYIVRTLGDTAYGIYAIIGTVIGYFALLDMGLGRAVVKYIAEYAGRKDKQALQETFSMTLAIFLVAGLAGTVLILLTAGPLATHILKIPSDSVPLARQCFLIAGTGFFFSILLNFFNALANGLNRYDISGSILAAIGLCSTLGAVLLLKAGFGLTALIWLRVLIPLFFIALYLWCLRRLIPGVQLRPRFIRKRAGSILQFGAYSILSRISDVVMRQAGPLIIGIMIGVAQVTYFVVPFHILNRITVMIVRMGMVVFPAVSELQGQNRPDTVRALFLTSSRMILSFSAAATVPLLLFGNRFLTLWISPEFAQRSGPVILLITAGIFINQLTNIPVFTVNGLGRPKVSGIASLATALLFAVVAIPASARFGIAGTAAAFLIAHTVVTPLFIRHVCIRILNLKPADYLRETFARPVLAGLLCAVPLSLIRQQNIRGLFPLIGIMAAGSALYFVIALLCGVYHRRERKILTEYARRICLRLYLKKAT